MSGNVSRPLAILYILNSIGESSAPYNELALALSSRQNITISTYFKSSISVPEEITLFEGNDSLKGFFRALKAALDERPYDIIHAHMPQVGFLFLVVSLFMSGRLMRSAVYTFHSSYSNYKLRNKLMLYPVLALFGRVVCCSYSSLESLPRILKWLAGERISSIQNGVDIDRVDRRMQNCPKLLEESRFTVVTVARLTENKRPFVVMNAFHQSNNRVSNLVFIGEGHLRAALTAEAKKLGLSQRIDMTGKIPREEVYEHLGTADLFISASGVEGLPIAVLEAMACRCPVILSDIPPHREIAGGVDFIPMIQLNDVNGIAEEIRRFQSMSSSERSVVGSRCRQLVERRFSLSSMHGGYKKVYLELLDQTHR